jgi:hypothetical protein
MQTNSIFIATTPLPSSHSILRSVPDRRCEILALCVPEIQQ